jgi:hypothetical protein
MTNPNNFFWQCKNTQCKKKDLCSFGKGCAYAHTEREVELAGFFPLCLKYINTGICQYAAGGKECKYLHPDDSTVEIVADWLDLQPAAVKDMKERILVLRKKAGTGQGNYAQQLTARSVADKLVARGELPIREQLVRTILCRPKNVPVLTECARAIQMLQGDWQEFDPAKNQDVHFISGRSLPFDMLPIHWQQIVLNNNFIRPDVEMAKASLESVETLLTMKKTMYEHALRIEALLLSAVPDQPCAP